MTYRTFIPLLALIFCLPGMLSAQQLRLYDGQASYDGNTYPCLSIEMEAPAKATKKAWHDYVKDEHDVNLKGIGFLANKDVLYAEAVNIPAIADKTMDFYTRIVSDNESTTMQVFGSFGYNFPISPGEFPAAYDAMRAVATNWLQPYLANYYQDNVEAARETLATIKSDASELRKEIEDNQSEIEKLEEEIEDYRKEVEDKEKDLSEAQRQLRSKESKLKTIKRKLGDIKTSN